jgi:hypothetical protein
VAPVRMMCTQILWGEHVFLAMEAQPVCVVGGFTQILRGEREGQLEGQPSVLDVFYSSETVWYVGLLLQ